MMVLRYMFGADDIQNVPHREWLLDFKQAIDDVRSVLKEQCRGDEFIGAKVGESTRYRPRDVSNKPRQWQIIYTTIRILPAEEMEWYLEDCIALKQEFPDLVAGFDIVGDENVARPLTDYIEPLLAFKRRTNDLGLDLPLILHAGETLSDGGKADNNLYDALLLGTKRIGHGYVHGSPWPMSFKSGQIFNCETPQADGFVPRERDRAGSMSYLVRVVS